MYLVSSQKMLHHLFPARASDSCDKPLSGQLLLILTSKINDDCQIQERRCDRCGQVPSG